MSADLLAQIRASPEDDALRQVFADWLIERDDPRGELIALQFKQARGAATANDDRRVRELLREHWWAWAGTLAAAIQRPESRFEKGFLSTVTLGKANSTHKLLRQIIGDEVWATVRHVEPAHIMATYARTVMHPIMKALRSVAIDHDHVADVCSGAAPWSVDTLRLRAWQLLDSYLSAIADCAGFAGLTNFTLQTGGESDDVMRHVLKAKLSERLHRLTLSLYGNSAHMPRVVDALACESPVATLGVELPYFACAATGSALEVTLRNTSEPAIALVTQFLAAARGRFTACTIAHAPTVAHTPSSDALVW